MPVEKTLCPPALISELVLCLAAQEILADSIEPFSLPPNTYKVANQAVAVHVAGAEIIQLSGTTRPRFATFPHDLACAFFLRRLPERERPEARLQFFALLEGLYSGDAAALDQQKELEVTIEAFKKFKRKTGDTPVKGALKVTAVGEVRGHHA
jgi:hypothetical protein